MTLTVEKALANVRFCWLAGGCASCRRELRKAVAAEKSV